MYALTTNGQGQPLNKLRWGQFKVANYRSDNEVIARRIIEVTMDAEGNEHLLAERMYTAGGFAKIEEFDAAIVDYAKELGIGEERVHFLDRYDRRNVPRPLETGDLIYRDSALPEIAPPMVSAPQLSAGTAMASAAHFVAFTPMLRTGT